MKPELTLYYDDEGTFVQGILEGAPFTKTSLVIESPASQLYSKKKRKVKIPVGYNSSSGSFSAESTKKLPLINPDEHLVLSIERVGTIYDRETFENRTVSAVRKSGASVQIMEKPSEPKSLYENKMVINDEGELVPWLDEEYTPIESHEPDDLSNIEF